MQVKTFKTKRGAEGFKRTLLDRWPDKLFQIESRIGLDFRNEWFVSVFIDGDKPLWVGVGPLTPRDPDTL